MAYKLSGRDSNWRRGARLGRKGGRLSAGRTCRKGGDSLATLECKAERMMTLHVLLMNRDGTGVDQLTEGADAPGALENQSAAGLPVLGAPTTTGRQ
jgi:hypothetical protein